MEEITLKTTSEGFFQEEETFSETDFKKVNAKPVIKIQIKGSASRNLEIKFKEHLYLKGIKNLIKKNEFLQLYTQLLDSQITEEEYENELTNHYGKYSIDLKPVASRYEFVLLMDIVSKITDQNLTADEFSEIFGISNLSLEGE